jgi:hypothetical protein
MQMHRLQPTLQTELQYALRHRPWSCDRYEVKMLLALRKLLRVNRYSNELDPFEQNHGSNELELDLNCALISLSRKYRPIRGEVGKPYLKP